MKSILLIIVSTICLFASEPAKVESKPLEFSSIQWLKSDVKEVARIQWENHDGSETVASVECQKIGEWIHPNGDNAAFLMGQHPSRIVVKFNRKESRPSETVVTSEFEPVVTKTDTGWEIRFLPSEL
jgi:hypothetical protein